jgi:hypothetical protein
MNKLSALFFFHMFSSFKNILAVFFCILIGYPLVYVNNMPITKDAMVLEFVH